jgi:SSS family solute:Na+ symporter
MPPGILSAGHPLTSFDSHQCFGDAAEARGGFCPFHWRGLAIFFSRLKEVVKRLRKESDFCYKRSVKLEFLAFFLAYLVLLLILSFVFSRRMKNVEDFFLASRRLPASLVFLSLAASWLGAASILVSTDEAYSVGLSAFWVMGVPAVLTVLVFYFFLARPIRDMPFVSLPDLVEMRYGRSVRHLASVLIIWYMILLAASQMVAVGNFIESFLGTSYFYGLLLGTAVVFVYSIFGGFFSVVVTDGFQFFLLITGLFCLGGFLLGRTNWAEVSVISSELGKSLYFSFFSDIERNGLMVLSFTLAWIISPIAWQRIQAAKTVKIAKTGLLAAGGTFFLAFWGIIGIGMLCLPLFPSGQQGGPLLAALIMTETGLALGAFLFVAIVAAIMSTMDTAINTGALSLVRDVHQQIFPSCRMNIITVSRLATVAVGLLAFLVATKLQAILETLGLASEIMAEGLFIPGIAMLFFRKPRPTAGLLALMFGGGYSLLGFLCQTDVVSISWPAWPYSVPLGLGICLVGFAAGWFIDSFS